MSQAAVHHLVPLAEAVGGLGAEWITALHGVNPSVVIDDDVDAMSDAGLLTLNDALATVVQKAQALHAHVANGISKRSAPELGKDGLARKAGYRTPAKLISATTGGPAADAQRLIQVGDATAGRMTFTGERAPARHPHVAAALERSTLSVPVASAITTLLDRVACKADRAVIDEAERTLVEQAAGMSLSDVQVLLRRAEAWLDPDGLEPKIEDLRTRRYLKIWEDQHGMINLEGRLDPETGAPIKTAIESLVTSRIRAMRGRNEPAGDDPGALDGTWMWADDAARSAGGAGAAAERGDATDAAGSVDPDGSPADEDLSPYLERRTVPQLQADALAALAKHALGCGQTALPLAATTVIVRIPLEALTTGTGVATIDGIAQPIDAGTARRMAADAEVIPMVLGADSEVLDCGRARRLFSRAQRLSLWERDGGCSCCGAPPGMIEAHHLTWWSRGGGTDLDNGILLCTSCHHMIHQDDWDIRVDGSDVWFVPPAHVDPTRTPRRGGQRRYDYQRVA